MKPTKEDLLDIEKIHRDIVIFCYGHNSRPELPLDETEKTLAKEGFELLAKFEDEYAEFSLPFRVVKKKHLLKRLIEDERYIPMDELRMALHSLIDPSYHGYGLDSCMPLWKDEEQIIETHYQKCSETIYERSDKGKGDFWKGETFLTPIPNPNFDPNFKANCPVCKMREGKK